MASKYIVTEISEILNKYSQRMDLVDGPAFRSEIVDFIQANKGLPDDAFIAAAMGQFGHVIDLDHKRRVISGINTIRTVVVLFLAIPVAAYLIYLIVAIIRSL